MDLQTEEDRLSALPDGVIGHILSFLVAKEAARATVLARRWRHAFAAVHTISFEQEEGSSGGTVSDDDYYYTAFHEEGCNAAFVALVDAAFASRRRCAAAAGDAADPGLRAFRVAFDSFHHSLAGHVDRWLAVVLPAAVEIHVDARRTGQRACARERSFFYYERIDDTGEIRDESDGEDADDFRNPKNRDRAYRLPRELFFSSPSAARLRTLCLGSCLLNLPPPGDGGHFLHLPSVETLALRRIPDSGKDIQRLIAACPRLADLMLDSCRRLRAVAVLDTRLHKLALRCCHGARLTVDASKLRALEYKGPVPSDDSAVLSFLGSPPGIVSCDIEFCGSTIASSDDVFSNRAFTYSDAELANLVQFLGRFANDAQCLRLGFVSLGAGIEKINGGLATFLCLRRLELKGTLMSDSAIDAVTAILERTPNLEVLTLAISPDTRECRWNEVTCDPKAVIDVPDVLPVIPCLQNRVLREINVAHYRGRTPQRKLLKLLLRLASALDELYVVFPKGEYAVQSSLMGEIYSWVMNPSAKVMFA